MIQPALFHLYTSSAYLRPNFKLNLSWTLSWQDCCWKLSNVVSSQCVRRDTPLFAVCLNTCPCRSDSNHSSRFVSLWASKSQTSHGIMPCCSFVACPGMLSTHWQWAQWGHAKACAAILLACLQETIYPSEERKQTNSYRSGFVTDWKHS